MSDDWVLDVTFWRSDAPLAFCPLDEDGSVISGLTVLASIPPGRMVGVAHADGQDAVEEWMGGPSRRASPVRSRSAISREVAHMTFREIAWIVAGALLVATFALVLPDWKTSIAYGIGIFIGSRMTRSEFRRLMERVRR